MQTSQQLAAHWQGEEAHAMRSDSIGECKALIMQWLAELDEGGER